jgi:hypothetical protein
MIRKVNLIIMAALSTGCVGASDVPGINIFGHVADNVQVLMDQADTHLKVREPKKKHWYHRLAFWRLSKAKHEKVGLKEAALRTAMTMTAARLWVELCKENGTLDPVKDLNPQSLAMVLSGVKPKANGTVTLTEEQFRSLLNNAQSGIQPLGQKAPGVIPPQETTPDKSSVANMV